MKEENIVNKMRKMGNVERKRIVAPERGGLKYASEPRSVRTALAML